MTNTMPSTLQAIKLSNNGLLVLNQLLLPHKAVYELVSSVEDGWNQIREMKVRGAPAIAIVAAISLGIDLRSHIGNFATVAEVKNYGIEKLQYLKTSRPTAVNLFKMADEFEILLSSFVSDEDTVELVINAIINASHKMLEDDVTDNKNIGRYGCEEIITNATGSINILTHCNTGSLATAGYGTALGVIRSLYSSGRLGQVYCTETRPYNQGARLTAYELVYENIPATLICDSMVAHVIREKGINAIVVGADRVVKNGDTANKIGTYQLAVVAKYHNIPFYVAAPTTSIDSSITSGEDITIEQRPHEELTRIAGVNIAAPGIGVYNPAFDVTPACLISGIITEKGMVFPCPKTNLYSF